MAKRTMRLNRFASLLVFCISAIVVLSCMAVEGKEEVKLIKREELREAMKSDRPPVLVNVLDRENYLEKRIPGSISLPLARIDDMVGISCGKKHASEKAKKTCCKPKKK